MAHIPTTHGVSTLLADQIDGTLDVRQGVITNASVPSDGAIRDMQTVADLLASATEAAVSGYARQDLANVAVTSDTGNDRVGITADAPTYSAPASGETWAGAFYFVEAATDSDRVLLSVDKVDNHLATNGADVNGPPLNYQLHTAT